MYKDNLCPPLPPIPPPLLPIMSTIDPNMWSSLCKMVPSELLPEHFELSGICQSQ